MNYDVVVCGAGPAGAVAAIALARAGARVLLLDRAKFPRHKLCGDTLNPGALGLLDDLGLAHVAADGLRLDGMIVSGEPAVQVEARYGDGRHGRSLLRRVLDERLVRAAAVAGAQFEEGIAVHAPRMRGDRVQGVIVRSADGRLRAVDARVVIAADGASSRLARALKLARHSRHPRRWAVGAYFHDVEGMQALGEMHVRRGRYIGVAPLPGALTNLCVVTADRSALRNPAALIASAAADPILAARFTRARPAGAPVCLGPLAVDASAAGVPGLLLAGDAAGFIDPMTGDGLRFALRGAMLAANEALHALEHGVDRAHERLLAARRAEFARKWRFNRALRALVASPGAVYGAARAAALVPRWVQSAIRYAGDLHAA